jgi:transposase InsO family protein
MPKTIYPVAFRKMFLETWLAFDEEDDVTFREHCSRFGVSHETGYDWLSRVGDGQLDVARLEPLSSAPCCCPHATSVDVCEVLIDARRRHPAWGPRKLRAFLAKKHRSLVLPAPSTIGDILKRAGLVMSRRRRRHAWPSTPPFVEAKAPNDVWTADFKGQFRTRDDQLCYPLTIADALSRYLIRCDAYTHPTEEVAKASFASAFRELGLPTVIHSDNGAPFASTAVGGLSQLSVWWIHLGILPERSRRRTPSDNGRHERMHRTLKAEATDPPAANARQQQRAFDDFRLEFNEERPHEALGNNVPAAFYSPSPRPYPRRLPEVEYPSQYELRRVDASGHFKWRGRQVFLSGVLAHEVIGIVQLDDGMWDVFFGPVLLGSLSDARPDLGLVPPPKR